MKTIWGRVHDDIKEPEKVRTWVRLVVRPETHSSARLLAALTNKPLSEVIDTAINKMLEEVQAQK